MARWLVSETTPGLLAYPAAQGLVSAKDQRHRPPTPRPQMHHPSPGFESGCDCGDYYDDADYDSD